MNRSRVDVNFAIKEHSLAYICEACANVYGVALSDLISSSRKTPLPEARGLASLIARIAGYKFKDIASYLNRTHPTIIHDINAFRDRVKVYAMVRNRYYEALRKLSK